MNKTNTLLINVLLFLFFTSGCGDLYYHYPDDATANYYYLNPSKNLSYVGRAALIELDNQSNYPEVSQQMTNALYQAMQKKQLFGITVFKQSDPAWQSLKLDIKSSYTIDNGVLKNLSVYSLEQLSVMRKTLRHDAILIGTITDFNYFPHMLIGLRLKLIDLNSGDLLWALEQIWDTADRDTEKRARKYFKHQVGTGFEPLRQELTTVSFISFTKFVSFEVAKTLTGK